MVVEAATVVLVTSGDENCVALMGDDDCALDDAGGRDLSVDEDEEDVEDDRDGSGLVHAGTVATGFSAGDDVLLVVAVWFVFV